MTYTKYRLQLRVEFLHTCGYCKIREPELGGSKSFHIDHYKPQSKFPALINDYNNLIYSCRNCNVNKGAYWPNLPLQHKILNPRQDNLSKHIDTNNFAWRGKTARGKKTVELLRLDSSLLIQQREDRMLVESTIARLKQIRKQHQLELIKSEENNIEISISQHTNSIKLLSKQIAALKRKIEGAMD